MLETKSSFAQVSAAIIGVLVLFIALSTPVSVHADNPQPDHGKCISCHEDLYLLHDTGNWFCLKESPMACVDCHGGDPTTLVKEVAHTNRAPHPVINEDVSKCQQCHPNECFERVQLFDQTAGISEVLVAAPYTPSYSSEIKTTDLFAAEQEQRANFWLNAMEFLPILLLAGIALLLYSLFRFSHPS